MQSKKVILFIVEGITDEISIGSVVTKLKQNEKIYFQIVCGDITSNYSSNSSNILKKINDQVEASIIQQHFTRPDILKIIHLVDVDGVFVDEQCIKYKDVANVEYDSCNINTRDIEKIKQRNRQKAGILNKLINTQVVNEIPYEIYFFSTNLEHVLHNIQNPKDEEKRQLAEKFQDKFYNNPKEFIQFINDKKYALKGSRQETWEFIRQNTNSLKRFTNFNLFFQ